MISSRSDECRVVDERLEPWADGELGARERALVERHLAGCERCRAAAAGARAVIAELRALPELAPSRAVLAELPRPPLARVGRSRWRWQWRWQAAAAAVVVAVGGGLAWHQQRLESQQLARATAGARYAFTIVAHASDAAGRQVADGLAVARIARAADRPVVRALASEIDHRNGG